MPLALLPVLHPGIERRIHVAFQKTKEYALGQMLRPELDLYIYIYIIYIYIYMTNIYMYICM